MTHILAEHAVTTARPVEGGGVRRSRATHAVAQGRIDNQPLDGISKRRDVVWRKEQPADSVLNHLDDAR